MSPLTRRSSFSRTSPSAVSQFRTELASLMKLINVTTTHYVRCVNPRPIERGDDGEKTQVFVWHLS